MNPLLLNIPYTALEMEALCAANGAMFRVVEEDGRQIFIVDRKGVEMLAKLSEQPAAALAQVDQRLAAVLNERA
ncbi:hypothetical protein [Streptomyces sp. NPDC048577]|uniref:hypothetical protein n=1 Tax=Streptomyces sp. NPDC048577 TaxID=3157209 RepID=UPI003437B0C0